MIIKTVSYVDFDGNEQKSDFYFNLTQAEIIEIDARFEEGISEKLTKIAESKNKSELVKVVKELIALSFGIKSEDGKRFIKSPEIAEEFLQTNAYSELFVELAGSADALSAFVNGIVPQGLRSQTN